MNQKNEIWKPVKDYEGLYEVSSLGRVRNKSGHILAQSYKQKTNYLRVHLSKNQKARWFSVHRLVAEAFVPANGKSKETVNHLDHDKTNNKAENLEWCSLQENCAYAASEKRYHVPWANLEKGKALLKKPVVAISQDGTEYIFDSIAQASRILGVNRSTIAPCCEGRYGRRTAGGYGWRYYEQQEQRSYHQNYCSS